MYEPAEAITMGTSVAGFTAPVGFEVKYTGQTIVNEPATLVIELTPTVNIDYLVLKFPRNGIRDSTNLSTMCPNCLKL